MKTALKALGVFLLVVGILLALSPLLHWAYNPALTQMQVLIECWRQFVGGAVMCVIGMAIATKMQRDKTATITRGGGQ